MSYAFDVYAGKINPTRNYNDYALFVSFFPLLLAGPIERAVNLLPQISQPRKLQIDKFLKVSGLSYGGYSRKLLWRTG
jgi:D-alanyl-lipoteichoic acid acyltransferase DltB (MBOAT superfamily)